MMLDDNTRLQAAEYALGIQPIEERRAFERQMAVSPDLRAEVMRWHQALSGLNGPLEPISPSPALWSRIETAITPPSSSQATAGPRRIWSALGWAIAAILASILMFKPAPPLQGQPIAILETADGASQFLVNYSAERQRLIVTGFKVNTAAHRSLQLWFITPHAAPESLGLLKERVTILSLNKPLPPLTLLAVSLEPAGGSPGPRPTGAILYKGMTGNTI